MSGEEVSFDSDGCSLAGTFTAAASPVAAALLITGSGRTDRDSNARLPGGRMLRIGVDRAVADALAAAQVSTLRYDKRGVGTSGGDYLRVGMPQRLADACAALGWLAARTVGDLSHLLRPDPESIGPRGYRRAVRQPVSPEVLGLITSWVARHWGSAVTSAAS